MSKINKEKLNMLEERLNKFDSELEKFISEVIDPKKEQFENVKNELEENRKQLEEIGVNKIDVCPYCTVCNNDLFFSYRKENATPYRHSAVIKLR